MKCSLTAVIALILLAMALLGGAMIIANYWPTVYPLFIAAGMVAVVTLVLIPAIKSALQAFAKCMGESSDCPVSNTINTLGQIAGLISFVAFAVAGALQIAALAFLYSWFLSWLFPSAEAAVATLVYSGIITCGICIALFLGLLTQVFSLKNCMTQQGAGAGSGNSA